MEKKINIFKIVNIIILGLAPLFLMIDKLSLIILINEHGTKTLESSLLASLLTDAIFAYVIFIVLALINYLVYSLRKTKLQISWLVIEIIIIFIFFFPAESVLFTQNIFLTLFWLVLIINNIIYLLINKLGK